jgi:hypothetical protein
MSNLERLAFLIARADLIRRLAEQRLSSRVVH